MSIQPFWVPLAIAMATSLPEHSRAEPTIPVPDELTLEAAQTLLLRHNPTLQAARLQAEIEQGNVITAEKLPNPAFQVGSEGLGSGGPGSPFTDQEFSLVLRQEILTAGKRQKRSRVERVDVEIASMEVHNLERLLTFELKRNYYQVVLAQADLEAAREIVEELKGVVKLNRLRFEQGEISGRELRQVEAAQYQFYEDLIRAEVNLQNAKDQLLVLLGSSDFERDFQPVDGFDPNFVPPLRQQLRDIALRERDDLAVQRARVRRSDLKTELERARAKPNPSVFGGYRRDFGQSGAIVGVELPIFVFNRNEGEIARSLVEGRQEEHRVRFLQVQVFGEIQLALNQLEGNRKRIAALEQEYLRISRESRDIADSAYRLGSASLIELLEAERTYRETRRNYNRALYDYQISRARLERAIGEDL